MNRTVFHTGALTLLAASLAVVPAGAQPLDTPIYSGNGVTFTYPDTYVLEETAQDYGSGPFPIVVLTDEEEVTVPFSEGPPTISMMVVPNPRALGLEIWLRLEDQISNFGSATEPEAIPVEVGGRAGLAYRYSGLYENDAVAVAFQGKIYLFQAAWIAEDDAIRADFQAILESVRFE